MHTHIVMEGNDMSRSRRHTPIFGNAIARSEKQDKRKANRRFRRKTRAGADLWHVREVSDVWLFAKDGKKWANIGPEKMRK